MKNLNAYEISAPIFIETDDCMGNSQSYYRSSATSPSGQVLMTTGLTSDEAHQNILQEIQKHCDFWSMNEEQRLFQHIADAKKAGRFYDRSLVDVIEILANKLFSK